jgi:hypothetical protein
VTNPETRYSGVVDVEFGKDVIVVQRVNLYGCAIGDGSFIGPFVEIQKAAKIGKCCRVQSHSFICELVTIGDDCFISHGRCLSMILFVTGRPAAERGFWRQTNAWQSRERWDKRYNPPSHDLRRGSHRGRRSHHPRTLASPGSMSATPPDCFGDFSQ